MSKLPIFELFLSKENLKPKLKWFFKPKLKPTIFLLNRLPEPRLARGALNQTVQARMLLLQVLDEVTCKVFPLQEIVFKQCEIDKRDKIILLSNL